MYDDHYGLTARPFQLTPDPRFWFETATHKKAMAYLGYGLSQGEGFIVITGDVGAGKTTLVGHLMNKVDRERLHVIKLVSTQIDAEDLLRLVAAGLEVETAGLTKSQLLTSIERGLHAMARSGRRTLLIVDEAQALPVGSLEELRMLSNFQAGGHALLQIFLLGQPEFRERLHGSDRLEQLRQRVIAMHHLDPMLAEEVEAYMVHRLTLVGWAGSPHFTPDAYAALFAGSDGVPRRLNQLAGRVMLYGAIEQLDVIDGRTVNHVLADIAGDAPEVVRPVIAPAAVAPQPTVPEPVAAAPGPVATAPALLEPLAPEPVAIEPEPVFEAPQPRPIVNLAPVSEPLPIRLSRAPEPEPATEPIVEQPVDDRPDLTPPPEDRLAAIEARLEDQEAAMRRILTLLVDWVEGGARPDMDSVHAAQAG